MARRPPPSGVRAVASREWRSLHADRWDWWMLTWIPLLVYAFTWSIFAVGVARELPIGVVDQDGTSLSRQLVRMLRASPGIAVVPVDHSDEAMHLMRARRIFGMVVVPAGLDNKINTGRSVEVLWLYNGQYQAHVGPLTRDVQTVVTTFAVGAELTAREKRGASPRQARATVEPVQVQLANLFNETGSYEAFLTLSLLPALLQILVAVAGAVAVGRELRHGTVPQWLDAAGGSWTAALVGKLAIPFACFAVQAVLFIAIFGGVRGWKVQGSGVMLIAGLLLLILACLAAGVLLVALTLSLRDALSLCAFYTAPAFAFAGQSYPVKDMPWLARVWAEILPLTHYLQLQTRHWMEGAPWQYGVQQLLVLALFTLVFGTLSLGLLKLRAPSPTAWGRL